MNAETFLPLVHLLGDVFWLSILAWYNFTFTDFPDYLPVLLIGVSWGVLLTCHRKGPAKPAFGMFVFAAVLLIASLGFALAYFPGFFAEYRGYFPPPGPTPPLVAFVATLMGGGNPTHIRLHNVTIYCEAWESWTFHTSLAFLTLYWKAMSIWQRGAALFLLLLPWLLLELVPNSPLRYFIG